MKNKIILGQSIVSLESYAYVYGIYTSSNLRNLCFASGNNFRNNSIASVVIANATDHTTVIIIFELSFSATASELKLTCGYSLKIKQLK